VQITHLGGKNLCTLDGNIIRLSDVSGARCRELTSSNL